MLAFKSLLLISSLAAVGDIQLLQFTAPWCTPCRMMEPSIQRLQSAGHHIRQIDIDRESHVAERFGVRSVPCFIMLKDGQEVERVEGATSFARLERMFASANTPPARAASPTISAQTFNQTGSRLPALPNSTRLVGAERWPSQAVAALDSSPSTERSGDAPPADQQSAIQRCFESAVRLKIEDAHGHSYGSGTVVDVHDNEALVVTCGHIFRESQGRGDISVELFATGARGPVRGHLISYDLDRDIALVAIRPVVRLTPVPVAGADVAVRPGERVFSIGCDRGGEPRVEQSRIVSVNRYLGPPNFVVSGRPVDGRSGGGLFTTDGRLIGICNAADPASDEGLFAALPVVHTELDKAGLAFVYQRSGHRPAEGKQAVPATSLAAAPNSLPSSSTGNLDILPRPAQTSGDVRPTAATLGAGRAPGGHLTTPDAAEVVCIVRSRNQPASRSQVIVLDQPSSTFLEQLSNEMQNQNPPHLTDLRVPRALPGSRE